MTGYIPGEQPDSPDIIKLNTNENPLPPSPAVQTALDDISADSLRRYPPPTAMELRKAIADHHRLDEENVIVTNGGDELLRLVLGTFVEHDESVAVAEPTYTLYKVLAQAYGCGFISFKLKNDWSFPDNFADELNSSGAKLLLLPNPQAPSGHLIPAAEISALADAFEGLILIDEAYVDFVDPALQHDCVELIRNRQNVLLLRTFSKGYSLAGLRMGYGLGASSLIGPMQSKTKDSYNTDLIAQKLALAAIRDQQYASKSWELVRQEREQLRKNLGDLGFGCSPSQSNFILVTMPPGIDAESLYLALKKHGILVRFFNEDGLQNCLRISIGAPEENQKLLAAIKRIIQ